MQLWLCNIFSKQSILSEIFRVFCFGPLINPLFKKDIGNSYSLNSKSEQTSVTYRVSRKSVGRSPVMPSQINKQRDRQTKKEFKKCHFRFPALNYTMMVSFIFKKQKIRRNFLLTDLYIYIYNDLIDLTLLQDSTFMCLKSS